MKNCIALNIDVEFYCLTVDVPARLPQILFNVAYTVWSHDLIYGNANYETMAIYSIKYISIEYIKK